MAQWRLNQLAVIISAGSIFAGYTLILPFVPLYIQLLGVRSPSQVALWAGTVLGISPLIAALIGPLWGRLADRVGLKIMAIRITFALALIWFLMAFAQNVWHLFLLRSLLGVFGGFNAFSIALATQLTPQEKVDKTIGTLHAVQIISTAVGPLMGGLLAGVIGIRKTFIVTGILCLFSLILFIVLYKDKERSILPHRSLKTQGPKHRSFKDLMQLQNFMPLAAVLFLITVIDRSFSPVIPLFIVALVKSPMQAARSAGLIISIASVAESLAAWYSGRRIATVPPKKFLLTRLVSGGIVSTALIFAASVNQLLALRVLLALLAGGTLTIAYTLASQVIPESDRATAFGLLSSYSMFGGAIGPLLGGLLSSLNIRGVFVANALIYAVLIGVVWKLFRPFKTGPESDLPLSFMEGS
jgi:DHA1 family multidrug resistance protein-like MFS transporter